MMGVRGYLKGRASVCEICVKFAIYTLQVRCVQLYLPARFTKHSFWILSSPSSAEVRDDMK
jgi:hypothetical protein